MIPDFDLYSEPTAADLLNLAATFKALGRPDLEAASVVLADEAVTG